MIKVIRRDEASPLPLPGRTWYTYITPENSAARNVSIGVSIFPPGSRPEGHVHEREEETIYVAAGRGRLVTPDATAELVPGTAILVSPGTPHATESDGPEPLELVCFFTPPVIPGSYESGPPGDGAG